MAKAEIRQDVQVVRGLAIIVVILFHFYPNHFPNGYLGVDQFFVISGYLMCMLLKKSENSPWRSLIGTFFFRRMKRILPLYLLTIFIFLVTLHLLLPFSILDGNIRSAEKSLMFRSNEVGNFDARDYFEKLSSATDLFAHTWSLSAEVQFYALVPFLFLATKKFSANNQIAFFSLIGAASFAFHVLTPRQEVAFNNVFARIWQFTFGMIVYLKLVNERRSSTDSVTEESPIFSTSTNKTEYQYSWNLSFLKSHSNSILILSFAITTYSLPINPLVARVSITAITSLFIYVASDKVPMMNDMFVFTGNISYALYLIHWPLYIHWKMLMIDSQVGLTFTLIVSVFISTFIHEIFEKWALKFDWKRLTLLIMLLTVGNMIGLLKEDIEIYFRLRQPQNSTTFEYFDKTLNKTFTNYDQVEIQNRIWQKNDFVQLGLPNTGAWVGINHRPGLPAGGAYKFMVLGSSTMANIAPLIQDECGSKAKEILQVTFPACEPLYPTTESRWRCSTKLNEYHEAVRDEKPDYLIMGARFYNMGDPPTENITNFDYDPVLAVARDQLQEYMKHVANKVVLLQAYPRPHIENLGKLVKYFRERMTPKEIDRVVVEPLKDGYELARKRYDVLLKECGEKCDFLDYTAVFHNTSTNSVRYFNEVGLSYFTLGLHLTPIALEIARPSIAELCKQL